MHEFKICPPRRPLWARPVLWKLQTRDAAVALLRVSITLAVISLVYGFWDSRLFWGAGFVFVGQWYYMAIKWVDRHGGWD